MHISNREPPEQDEKAEAQDCAILRLQALLLAASATVIVLAMAFNQASGRLACAALAAAPC